MKEKWIEVEQMKRLTMDNVEEMGMFSLAHNCCYIDENGNTRYRDFEIDGKGNAERNDRRCGVF